MVCRREASCGKVIWILQQEEEPSKSQPVIDEGKQKAGGGFVSRKGWEKEHLFDSFWEEAEQGPVTLVAGWVLVVKATFRDVRRRVPQGPV